MFIKYLFPSVEKLTSVSELLQILYELYFYYHIDLSFNIKDFFWSRSIWSFKMARVIKKQTLRHTQKKYIELS